MNIKFSNFYWIILDEIYPNYFQLLKFKKMRIPEFLTRFSTELAPIDLAETKDLEEAIRYDYKIVTDSIISKKKQKEDNDFKKQQFADKISDPKLSDKDKEKLTSDFKLPEIEDLTMKEKVINFMENPYCRYALWWLFIFTVPAAKRYLFEITHGKNDDKIDSDPNQFEQFTQFMEFQNMKKRMI